MTVYIFCTLNFGYNLINFLSQIFTIVDKMLLLKILFDSFLLVLAGTAALITQYYGKPVERGFFCNDESIRYPVKESSISYRKICALGISLTSILILVNEFFNERSLKPEDSEHIYVLFGRAIPNAISKAFKKIGVFFFGICITSIIVGVAKVTIGRLRPCFIELCQPDFNCAGVDHQPMYVNFAKCLGSDEDEIREARLSFPSGHSAFAAYIAVYTLIYVQASMICRFSRLLKPLLQSILIIAAWYVSLTGISDFKHHWDDVVAGLLLGTINAIAHAFYVADLASEDKEKNKDTSLEHMIKEPLPANYNTMKMTDIANH